MLVITCKNVVYRKFGAVCFNFGQGRTLKNARENEQYGFVIWYVKETKYWGRIFYFIGCWNEWRSERGTGLDSYAYYQNMSRHVPYTSVKIYAKEYWMEGLGNVTYAECKVCI